MIIITKEYSIFQQSLIIHGIRFQTHSRQAYNKSVSICIIIYIMSSFKLVLFSHKVLFNTKHFNIQWKFYFFELSPYYMDPSFNDFSGGLT